MIPYKAASVKSVKCVCSSSLAGCTALVRMHVEEIKTAN